MQYEMIDRQTGRVAKDDGDVDMVVGIDGKDWLEQLAYSLNNYKSSGRYYVRQVRQ